MGIVYTGQGYKNLTVWPINVSRQRTFKPLTRQNIEFLKNLGFQVKNLGGK